MSSEVVAGVDIGSSSARAIAVDRDGVIVATTVARYDQSDGLPVGEVDPAVWLDGLAAAVGQLECELPAALCVGGHGPTTVASTGQLALTFRHPAGATSGPVEQHVAQTAVLQERFGDHVEPRQSWDFLISQLGGDPTVQSVWPTMAGLKGFGDEVPVGANVGTSNGTHGLPEGITLVPGSNDAYMTAWATAIDTPGRGFDPGGKTGGLGVAVAAADHRDLAEFGMASHVPGVSIVGGPVASHGAIMDWWSSITGRDLSELLEMAAAVDPGSGGVLVLPFLEGERAPRWNLDLRAEITGLSLGSDVATITRALLESTAYGLGHVARDLAAQGVTLDRVVCSGGPSRSRLWTSIKAAVLEVPIDVPASKHMAAYGAALGAGSALGWWPRPGEGMPGDWPMPAMTTIEPEPLGVYRDGLDRFIALGDEAVARLQKTQDD
jgi:xylulokinase